MENVRSEQLFNRAQQRIPGGVNSPVRAFGAVGRHPFFVQKAQGPWLFDADGHRYLDYVCSWGPGILGHAHPKVVEAVRRACADGLTFGAPTAGEVELSELIGVCVPDVEMVRLVSSGTEAVMSAVRVARGFTGREKIIKFAGNYHGHSDGLLVKAGSGLMTQSEPDSAGVPAGYAADTLTAVYNDEESVRALMEENYGRVAAVVVEPVAANMGVVPPKKARSRNQKSRITRRRRKNQSRRQNQATRNSRQTRSRRQNQATRNSRQTRNSHQNQATRSSRQTRNSHQNQETRNSRQIRQSRRICRKRSSPSL